MLSGDRPPGCDAHFHDLPAGLPHPPAEIRVAPVVADVRVEVAVAGVEHIADGQVVPASDLLDPIEDLRQPGAGHHRVLDHQVRGDPPHGSEGFLTALP